MTAWKKTVFIILFNLIVLALIEITLHIVSYGSPTSLFIEKNITNTSYLTLNQDYIHQYYSVLNSTIPNPLHTLFTKQKPNNLYRIFVFGESTSQGFPYSQTLAFPYQLGQMLEKAVPGKKFEVINLSITAINTFTGLSMLKESLKYKPDLAIIYFGHNEFVGIGGSGLSENPLFQANIYLSKLRIYQLVKSILSKLQKKDDRSVIERMAQKARVPLDSPVYKKTIKLFERNYSQMLSLLKKYGIPVITCGVAANHKDFQPLSSSGVSVIDTNGVKNLIQEVSELTAEETLKKLTGSDPLLYYQAAKGLLSMNKPQPARACFQKACDLDQVRFRAHSDINRIIERLSIVSGAAYYNAQEELDKASPYGITGNELLLEHVHPVIEGHTLIAAGLTGTILSNILKVSVNNDYQNIELMKSLVDNVSVANKLNYLYTTYPLTSIHFFNPVGYAEVFDTKSATNIDSFQLKPGIPADEFTFLKQNIRISDDNLHTKFGVWLFNQKKDNRRVHNELITACLENPLNFAALNNLAVWEYFYGDKVFSEGLFQRITALKPNNPVPYRNYFLILKDQKRDFERDKIQAQLEKFGRQNRPASTLTFLDVH